MSVSCGVLGWGGGEICSMINLLSEYKNPQEISAYEDPREIVQVFAGITLIIWVEWTF